MRKVRVEKAEETPVDGTSPVIGVLNQFMDTTDSKVVKVVQAEDSLTIYFNETQIPRDRIHSAMDAVKAAGIEANFVPTGHPDNHEDIRDAEIDPIV